MPVSTHTDPTANQRGSAAFEPGSDFMLLAGFYVVAQGIERIIEMALLLPRMHE